MADVKHIINRSIYEKYCDEKQPEILSRKSDMTLDEVIVNLKKYKKFMSETIMEGMYMIIADEYNLSETEVERLVKGDKYWLI